MNYTSITLGVLLSSENETIKRNAVGILKALQGKKVKNIKAIEEDICTLDNDEKQAIREWLESSALY